MVGSKLQVRDNQLTAYNTAVAPHLSVGNVV